jgi:hypothetical protein
MRSDKEIAAEALRRAAIIKARRKRRRGWLAAGATFAVCLSIALCISVLQGSYLGSGPPSAAAQSAPLMFPGAGGYVVCGVLCFVSGAAVALFCTRRKGKTGDDSKTSINQEVQEK